MNYKDIGNIYDLAKEKTKAYCCYWRRAFWTWQRGIIISTALLRQESKKYQSSVMATLTMILAL